MTQGHKAWRRSQTGDQRPSAAPLTVLKKEAALGPVCDWGGSLSPSGTRSLNSTCKVIHKSNPTCLPSLPKATVPVQGT